MGGGNEYGIIFGGMVGGYAFTPGIFRIFAGFMHLWAVGIAIVDMGAFLFQESPQFESRAFAHIIDIFLKPARQSGCGFLS